MLDWADLALSNITLPPLAMAFGFAQGWSWNKGLDHCVSISKQTLTLRSGSLSFLLFMDYLRVYGGIGLRIWGFGFGLSIDAVLHALCL